MKLSISKPVCALALLAALAGCASDHAAVAATATTQPATQPTALHIHLPGIGGYRGVDRGMLRGLREAGYTPRIRAFDWTGEDAGLAALVATRRHRDESTRLAAMIADELRTNPGTQINISTHSAGAGIIAWALEQLPPDVQIDTLLLIAPALSPQYDLSRALTHVRGKAYVIYSPYDTAVLGIGTQMFGTVDGLKVEAAGKVGFTAPPKADKQQYEKLVQIPYRSAWIKLGNIGDHIGGLSRPFSRAILEPLLARGELPAETTPEEPLSVPPPLPAAATAPATLPAPAASGQ
ncbi:MAG: hypothetical protein QOF78_2842 [Phycisphaerales bacterium]|jgi:hypothetical protein|nr:hypothetical protein [Phycisphaerales bacterium]